MAVASARSPRHSRPWQVAASLGPLLLLLAYVTAIWGRAGLLLPSPLDNWHHVVFRAITRWNATAQHLLQGADRRVAYSAIEAYVLGLLAPAALLALVWRRPLRDVGLRWPGASAWRWTALGVAVSVPVGLWITAHASTSVSGFTYAVRLLMMIPEHFLICGVGVALLLPGHRLPDPPQPAGGWRLAPASLFAVLGSAGLFALAHVGARPAELAFSVPMGLFCAYVTWRTASIWPALLAHWSLNLVPLGLRAMIA